jgi:hypothetical protein
VESASRDGHERNDSHDRPARGACREQQKRDTLRKLVITVTDAG